MNSNRLRSLLSGLPAEFGSRRLFAVLGALVVIAVAIPLLLSRSGQAASLAPVPSAPTVTARRPVATAVTTGRRHLVSRNYLAAPAHNPFVYRHAVSAAAAREATAAKAAAAAAQDVQTGSSASGGSSGAQSTTSVPTRTVIEAVPQPAPFSNFEAQVSLRESGTDSQPQVLNALMRFQLLPSDSDAFASFLGIREDRQTAVFLLADWITVSSGQGTCTPTPWKCSVLTLEPGESVTLRVPSGDVFKDFTLRYGGVRVITSSASLTYLDLSGRADVAADANKLHLLKKLRYAYYTGLLSIPLGTTTPVSQSGR